MIVEELLPEREPEVAWPGYWRMSGVGGCQKALLAYARGEGVYALPRSNQYWLAANEGIVHENDMLLRLQQKGYSLRDTSLTKQAEVKLTDWRGVDWPLVGHPDGLIAMHGAWWLLELKSKDRFMYDRYKKGLVKDVFPVEYAQVQCYMAATSTDNCLYICKNRGTGQLYEEIIRFDPQWLDAFLLEHFGPVVDAYQNGTSIDNLACHSDPHVRRWCPMENVCSGKLPMADVAVVSSVTPSLDAQQAIAQWREAKEMADEAKRLDEEARNTIREFMVQNGMKKASIDGVPVTIYVTETESIDRKKVRELLPEEVWPEVFSKTSGERMRVG